MSDSLTLAFAAWNYRLQFECSPSAVLPLLVLSIVFIDWRFTWNQTSFSTISLSRHLFLNLAKFLTRWGQVGWRQRESESQKAFCTPINIVLMGKPHTLSLGFLLSKIVSLEFRLQSLPGWTWPSVKQSHPSRQEAKAIRGPIVQRPCFCWRDMLTKSLAIFLNQIS